MKKFLALLLSLSMVLALSACGTGKPIGDLLKGNTGVSGQQETENPGGNAGEFDFGAILSGNGGSELYSGYSAEQKAALVEAAKADGMDATIKQMRGYTDKVKAAGFTVGAEVEDQELMGMVVYTYSASNAAGYQIEIYSAAGISGLTIRK